ncbi:hypothetical protein MTO96_005793, partial [Rhipicephalus appendiculatus]
CAVFEGTPHLKAQVLSPVQTWKERQPSPVQCQQSPKFAESIQHVLLTGQGESSFDRLEVPQDEQVFQRGYWQLVWITGSVACITLLFPIVFFILPALGGGGRFWTVPWSRATGVRTAATTSSTEAVKRVTYDAEENYLLPAGTNITEFCNEGWDRDARPPPSTPLPAVPRFVENTTKLQQRIVFCNLDIKYWRSIEPYLPSLLPTTYCTAVIVAGYAIRANDSTIVWKYPGGERYLHTLAAMRANGQLNGRFGPVPIYATVGGDRQDSLNFSRIVNSVFNRRNFDLQLRNFTMWQGVHLDWNYPGDKCSAGSSMQGINFRKMAEALANGNHRVIVSVPAIPHRSRLYDIEDLANTVDYIIVKTHAVRSYGLVAPETFTAEVAQLGAPSSRPSRWDNYTLQPGKAHYTSVCRQPVIRTPEHPECLMAQRRVALYHVNVATFSDPAALHSRVRKAYLDGMGMTPLMVYDIDLDDYHGLCGFGMSPLLRVLATAAYT